jgi:hypothetical protein
MAEEGLHDLHRQSGPQRGRFLRRVVLRGNSHRTSFIFVWNGLECADNAECRRAASAPVSDPAGHPPEGEGVNSMTTRKEFEKVIWRGLVAHIGTCTTAELLVGVDYEELSDIDVMVAQRAIGDVLRHIDRLVR